MRGKPKGNPLPYMFLAVFFSLILLPCVARAEAPISRPDALSLAGVDAYGSPQKAPVLFLHDAHTAAPVEAMKNCTTCHATDKRSGRLDFRFAPTVDADGKTLSGKALMDAWHNGCGGCHAAMEKPGQPSGPIQTAMCASCHAPKPSATQSGSITPTTDIMSDAVHDAHMASDLIQGKDGDDNCAVCHHAVKNAAGQTIPWEAGEEIACAECHGKEGGKAPSLRQASHRSCLSCHDTMRKEAQVPLLCVSCHRKAS